MRFVSSRRPGGMRLFSFRPFILSTSRMDPISERNHVGSTPRACLDRGLQLEQAGALERALEMYSQVLAHESSTTERIEAHIRIARVHRAATAWGKSRT